MSTPKAKGSGNDAITTDSDGKASNAASSLTKARTTAPAGAAGHVRTRSVRAGGPVSARAAAQRREANLSNTDSDARAEAALVLDDLQKRLGEEEKVSESYKKQAEVLQSKLDEATKESAKLEEKVHEQEEQLEGLQNEKRESTRQMREMETIYEAEKSSILKEKEGMANREEELQTIIQRLKDTLVQRNNYDDEPRPSRQGNASPSIDGGFAPPSSVQRSDSRSSSKLILQKDKLIESLRLELAEAQIKLVESENQGGGRLQDVERLLMEARMANARLMEDNESYQLLLQERTLKGDFGQHDFSYMGNHSNRDALNALEGKSGNGGSSLADELSEAAHNDHDDAGGDRRLESDLKSAKEQNKALTLYINKIIERLLQHQDFEHILDQSSDPKPEATAGSEKRESLGSSLLERAKSIAVGPKKPRPVSILPNANPNSGYTDPTTAPSIPVNNLSRAGSVRRSRPQSEHITAAAASLVGQMYKGPDGPLSPALNNPRHSQTFFSPSNMSGSNPNAAARAPSTATSQTSSANFPGLRSETSSLSEQSGDVTTPPSQSPPRSHSDKQTTFSGSKPRPLRLVQENPDAVRETDNKRASWYTGWGWNKKDETSTTAQGSLQPKQPIPE